MGNMELWQCVECGGMAALETGNVPEGWDVEEEDDEDIRCAACCGRPGLPTEERELPGNDLLEQFRATED